MHVAHLLIYIIIFKAFIHQPVEATILDTIKQFFTHSTSDDSQEKVEPSFKRENTQDHVNIIQQTINKRMTCLMKREAMNVCDDEELMVFLAELQVTNPESIINLSTQEELPVICKRVSDSLAGMENYLKTCTLPSGKDLYVQLIKGIAQFVDVMCEKDTEIKRAFTECSPCLKSLHSDFENCYGPSDWTEDIKKRDICCAYKQISDCYYTKAAEVCGKHSAHVMKKVVMSIINVIIPVHCATIVLEPCVDSVAPDKGSQTSLKANKILVIVLVTYTITNKCNSFLQLLLLYL